MLRNTRNPHRRDKDDDRDNADFPELIATQGTQDPPIRQFDEAECKADDVTCVQHAPVPCVGLPELFRRGYVEEEVAE